MGSVVKQCLDDQPEEDDDEDDGSDGVFGVTTVLNITKRKVSKKLISVYLYMAMDVNRAVLYMNKQGCSYTRSHKAQKRLFTALI